MKRINIAVVCDRDTAEDFIWNTFHEIMVGEFKSIDDEKLSFENDVFSVQWIKPYKEGFKAKRVNYIYTTPEIAESEWYRNVIEPMLTHQPGIIKYKT